VCSLFPELSVGADTCNNKTCSDGLKCATCLDGNVTCANTTHGQCCACTRYTSRSTHNSPYSPGDCWHCKTAARCDLVEKLCKSGLSKGSAIAVGLAVFIVMIILGAFWYMHQKRQQPQYSQLSVNDNYSGNNTLVGGFEGGSPQFPSGISGYGV
jgi:hypothetical protein